MDKNKDTVTYVAWLNKDVVGVETAWLRFEVPVNATEAEIEKLGREALDSLIDSELDTGWDKASDVDLSGVTASSSATASSGRNSEE